MGPVPEKEKILVVDTSLEDRTLIARQTLAPLGFEVETAETAAAALQLAVSFAPDVILSYLNLPDLNGKDLLVALKAQGIEIPFILIVDKGQESAVIQAFRLGAGDYLTRPLREAEVVSAVERAMQDVRVRREREQLARQLQQANRTMERKIRDLEKIFSIGKAITSITRKDRLFKTVLSGAMSVGAADRAYLLARDENDRFVLAAHARLPAAMAAFKDRPLDDGISSLVAMSGKTLAIHGERLQRFNIATLGRSAIVVPLKTARQIIGLMVLVRKEDRPFKENDRLLLEAVGDYAAVSMANSDLILALEARARGLQLALNNTHAGQVHP